MIRISGGLRAENNFIRKKKSALPLVTIVTVCLNSERYLEQTIISVLSQTYTNIEYLIIDGGSTDATLDIIKKYEHKIDYWVSEPDKGLYDAMNKGLRVASGDLIGFINSDDYYCIDSVKHIVDAWVNDKNNADILYGDIIVFDEEETGIKWRIYADDNLKKLLFKNIIHHPSCFVKKTMYEEYGNFDIKFKILADYDFALRLYLKSAKFKRINKVLAIHRFGGISNQWNLFRPVEYYMVHSRNGVFILHRTWAFIMGGVSLLRAFAVRIMALFLGAKIINGIKTRRLLKKSGLADRQAD